MTKRKPATERQQAGVCTWCGHPVHGDHCYHKVKAAVGPTFGHRAVPAKITICLCRKPAENELEEAS